jgi:hypothetical protein
MPTSKQVVTFDGRPWELDGHQNQISEQLAGFRVEMGWNTVKGNLGLTNLKGPKFLFFMQENKWTDIWMNIQMDV